MFNFMHNSEVAIPEPVLANWHRRYPDVVSSMVIDAQHRLHYATSRWHLSDLVPIENALTAAVFTGRTDGNSIVLKVNPTGAHTEGAVMTLASKYIPGRTPHILAHADEFTTFLMERVAPGGTLLRHPLSTIEAYGIMGSMVKSWHGIPTHAAQNTSFVTHLKEHYQYQWWEEELRDTPEHALINYLMETTTTNVLLHLDLHAENVILDAKEDWKVIDPKPCFGDAHADVFGFFYHSLFMHNLPPANSSGLHSYVSRHLYNYCSEAGLDYDRASAWIRVRALARYRRHKRGVAVSNEEWVLRIPQLLDALPLSSVYSDLLSS